MKKNVFLKRVKDVTFVIQSLQNQAEKFVTIVITQEITEVVHVTIVI